MPVHGVPCVSSIKSAAVVLPLKPFLSHQACIAVSYVALPSAIFGYGFCLSQFASGSPAVSLVLPVGVVSVPTVGEANGAWVVLGVVWNGLVGLLRGLPLNGNLFWFGVRGVGGGFGYFGGGVPGSMVWGAGGRLGVGVGIGRGWSVIRAMTGVSPEVCARSAATSV